MEIEKFPFQTRFKVSQTNTSVGYTHVLCCPCCIFCTLSFANLHKHALTHEDSELSSYRTYTCSKCFSTSTEKYLMQEHVNIYHRNTKRPVELTEEIHTILRKSEPNDQLKTESESIFNLSNLKKLISPKKMEMKRRMVSQTSKKYSKINRRLKMKSRINKFARNRAKKIEKDILDQNQERESLEKTDDQRFETQLTNENEPIDMTIKTDFKNTQSTLDDKSAEESESRFPNDYSNGFQTSRSYLYDVLSKSPMPPGFSQSFMLRYFTAQIQSLQAAKYFNSNFLFPSQIMPPQEPNFQQRTFDSHQPPSSVTKIQENNSLSQRNLHRNNFSPFQNHILLEWYDNHKHKPYPSTEETKHLATLCGLSYPQVKKWFANKRARSSFYQKDEIISCQSQARYNLLRFPLQISNRLNSDVVKTLEAQFSNSLDNIAMVSNSSHEDSVISA